MNSTDSYAVGVGAANVDVHGRSRKPLILRDSNPGRMNTSSGGVTRNILENLCRLGGRAKLVAALGDDVYAEKILRDSERAGVDMQYCIRVPKSSSSTYISVLDDSGDMFVALSDMTVAQSITRERLDERRALFEGAAVIVTDPCFNADSMRYLVGGLPHGSPVFVDPVSTYYASTIAPFIGDFHTVKPNELELSILAGIPVEDDASVARACDILLRKGVQRVFVSRGAKGCYYKDSGGTVLSRAFRPVEQMVNATGAGDAFMGAVAYSWLRGFDAKKTVEYALAAGALAVMAYETISPLMSVELIEKTIEENENYGL